MGFELILPFLRPIEHLILDEEISEIMVNGSGRIFIERRSNLIDVPGARLTEKNLQVAVRNIARALGDEVSEQQPLLDSRLPDGSRVAAVIPPCSIGGTTLTIRKFQSRRFTADEVVRIGVVDASASGGPQGCHRESPKYSHQRRNRYGEDNALERIGTFYWRHRAHCPDRRHGGNPTRKSKSSTV
jgi:hypothetical protein